METYSHRDHIDDSSNQGTARIECGVLGSGVPSEPTVQVILVIQKIKLKYPSFVGPIARAMTTVVSRVQTKVINTSRPMKMKLRPTTLELLGAGMGGELVNIVKPFLDLIQ